MKGVALADSIRERMTAIPLTPESGRTVREAAQTMRNDEVDEKPPETAAIDPVVAHADVAKHAMNEERKHHLEVGKVAVLLNNSRGDTHTAPAVVATELAH